MLSVVQGEGPTAEQGSHCGALMPPRGPVHAARGRGGGTPHTLEHSSSSAAAAVTPTTSGLFCLDRQSVSLVSVRPMMIETRETLHLERKLEKVAMNGHFFVCTGVSRMARQGGQGAGQGWAGLGGAGQARE